MILDERTEFCDAVALNTGSAGNYLLGDVIDLGEGKDLGNSDTLYLVIQVDTAATSGGSATASFSLLTDDNESLSSPAVLVTSPVWAVADMTAGKTLQVVQLPMEGTVYERYLGIRQTTAVAAFTAGKINAFITHTPARWKAYDAPFQL
jgi:hypothetical protein